MLLKSVARDIYALETLDLGLSYTKNSTTQHSNTPPVPFWLDSCSKACSMSVKAVSGIKDILPSLRFSRVPRPHTWKAMRIQTYPLAILEANLAAGDSRKSMGCAPVSFRAEVPARLSNPVHMWRQSFRQVGNF